MFRRVSAYCWRIRKFLSQFDWPAIVGSALALVFVLGFIGPVIQWSSRSVRPTHNQPTYEASSQEPDNLPWWKSSAVWTAIFTGVLTLSTIGLWLQTKRLAEGADDQSGKMERSIAAAQTSADAAQLQAKAMIASVRAALHLETPSLERGGDITPIKPGGIDAIMFFRLPIRNLGNSIATIQTTSLTYEVVKEPRRDIPLYRNIVGIAGQPIKKDAVWDFYSIIMLKPEELEKIRQGNEFLWYYGFVRYTDFMDDVWDIGFVGWWEEVKTSIFREPRGIIPSGPPVYTYTRRLQPKQNE